MAVRGWADDESEVRVPVVSESLIADDITIAVLIKPQAKASTEIIISGRDSAGDDQWAFGTNSSNKPFFFTANGSQTNVTTGMALTDDVWYIVAYTKQGTGGLRGFHVFELGGAWEHATGDLGGSATAPATTAGGFVSFGFIAGNDDLNARMGVAGIWKTAFTDEQIEALAENLTTSDWSAHEINPGGVWNFNQPGASDAILDYAGNHAAITGTITGATDTNGISGAAPVFGEDPPGWDFFAAPPALRMTFRFSGGASNSDPALSLGGAESSEGGEAAVGLTGVLLDVIRDFTRPDAIAGTTVYRGIYVHLEDNGFASPADVALWLDTLELAAGVTFAIGVAVEAAGVTMATVADETTAPGGVSFGTPTTEGAAVSLGTLAGGEGRGVWLRVTLTSNGAGGLNNAAALTAEVTPL